MKNVAPTIAVQCKHCVEPDGSWACICAHCLLTLARGKNESELHRDIAQHICNGEWRLSEVRNAL